MLRQNRARRAGFTLIELLVVMGIIAVLLGLLLSGVMKVLSAGPRTDTQARMKGLDAAIGSFKADRFGGKGYIPAGQVDINPSSPTFGQVIGPFRLRNSYTSSTVPDANSFEAQYIAQVFGARVNLPDLGGSSFLGTNTFPLDSNQTLLFFLGGVPKWDGQGNVAFTGFSNNPAQPFTPVLPTNPGESRKGPYLDISRKMYDTAPMGTFPHLIDAYGTPFAYFTSFNGKSGFYGGWSGTAKYYMSGGKPVNATGWQIISAGEDRVFVAPTQTTPVDWANVDAGSRDNLANFSTKILGAGPSAQ